MMEKKSNPDLLLRYLIEFRKRALYCFLVLAVIFFILLCFANELYTFLALPLLKYAPNGLIATQIVSSFFVPFELAFFVALFIAIPFFLYQCWIFIAPGLYQHEKRFLFPLMLISVILFYMGLVFAYEVIFPILFKFLLQAAPHGVTMMPDIAHYLRFTLKLFLIFGMIFEVPVLTILLIWTGWITRERMVAMRSYVIVGAFIIGMLLGPPDVFSQILIAIPLWLLFECGLFLSPLFLQKINTRM